MGCRIGLPGSYMEQLLQEEPEFGVNTRYILLQELVGSRLLLLVLLLSSAPHTVAFSSSSRFAALRSLWMILRW